MIYKSFRINCIIRILLIIASLYVFFYLFFKTQLYFTMIFIAFLPVVQTISLLNYINKTNIFLTQAFLSIQYDDFSERIKTRVQDSSFKEICEALNQIIEKFQKNRMEKEQQFQYLQAVIHQTGMGLISFTSEGKINLINKAARKMLKISPLNNMRQLESVNKEFTDSIVHMKTGERKHISFNHGTPPLQLAVYAKDIRLNRKEYRVLTFQNIQKELEEKEMDAWKNLIRVLSHEIMNSITPISSLAATANMLMSSEDKMSQADIEDIRMAIQTIEKRSQGLMQFVKNYRQFAQLPKPDFRVVPADLLFQRIKNLFHSRLERKNIELKTSIEPDNLNIKADPDLIEQVLLNLMSNAVEAVKETHSPRIELTAVMDGQTGAVINVADNGHGIKQDVLPRIFIPFFTTRSKGSGIGLSLSRQIMRLHEGNIRVNSEPGVRTVFSLLF
ncbi:ATP-binding protein [Desulfobacterales bacterium HSG17]|nr:ATP-binding protein [Desulfobacterales bacterium HSG17]